MYMLCIIHFVSGKIYGSLQGADSSQIVDTEISCSHFTCRVFATWIKNLDWQKLPLIPCSSLLKASGQLIYCRMKLQDEKYDSHTSLVI